MTRIMHMTDADLIDALGGPMEVLRRLGWPEEHGLQRICNWRARGIPYKIQMQYLSMWQEAGRIVLACRDQKRPLPTYWQRRRAEAAARIL